MAIERRIGVDVCDEACIRKVSIGNDLPDPLIQGADEVIEESAPIFREDLVRVAL